MTLRRKPIPALSFHAFGGTAAAADDTPADGSKINVDRETGIPAFGLGLRARIVASLQSHSSA